MSEVLGEAVLYIRTDDTGYPADIARAKTSAEGLGMVMDRTSAKTAAVTRSMGAMGGAGRQLSYQLNDVATMWMMGAPPMQIFISQGGQVVQILQDMSASAKANDTSLTRMATGSLARIGPYAVVGAAAVGVLALALRDITDEINENSTVTVTWQDTALGALDAVAAFASDQVTAAFQSMGLDVDEVLQSASDGVRNWVNAIVGQWVFAARASIAAWQTFPGAFMEFVVDAANGAIAYLEGMLNRGVSLLNQFAKNVGKLTGVEIGQLGMIDLPALEQNWRGATGIMRTQMGNAREALTTDWVGAAVDAISPYAQENARERLAADAAEAGHEAGREMGRAAARDVTDALKEAARLAAQEAADRQGKLDEADQNLRDKLKAEAEIMDRARQETDEAARRRGEEQIQSLAGLYETLFSQGVGGVWDQFKRQGIAAIALIAARWTAAMLAGQSANLGNIASQVMGENPLTSLFSQSGGMQSLFAGFFADGGLIPSGQFGIVGERGPEMVIGTPGGAQILPSAGGRAGNQGPTNMFDLRGAVVTEDLLRQMDAIATGRVTAGLQSYDAGLGNRMANIDARFR